MSDEIIKTTDEIEKRKKKRHAKKNRMSLIIVLLLVVSVSCTLYINMENPLLSGIFSNFGISNNAGENIEFEKTENYAISAFDDDVIVARSTLVSCINHNLGAKWSVEQKNPMPVIKTDGKYVLTYSFDVADAIITKDGKSQNIVTQTPVIGGSVNKNGYFAIVTREKGYKACVTVYSPKCEVIYKWHSADNYIIDVDVSYDNKCLAVATADFSTDVASGGLMFFNFSQEKPYAGQILENNIVMDIEFIGKNSLLAVGDIAVNVFGGDGEKKKEFLFEDKKLTNYHIGTEDNVVLALAEGDSVLTDSQIVILNNDLKQRGQYTVKGAVTSLDFVSDRVLLSADRNLILLNSKGKELKTVNLNKDIKKAVLFGNKKEALVASGGVAEVVKID